MRVSLVSVLVEDQDKALAFYTNILGFEKMADIPMGEFRWLTVTSPDGVAGVEVVSGPLKAGFPGKAPFDVIFVNGAVEEVPAAWLSQLAEGGRLVVAVAEGSVRRARIYTASGGKTAWRTPFDTPMPMLAGFEKASEFRL